MPALSKSHAAAVRACVALLEAFDSGHSGEQCYEMLRLALQHAMDATGLPKDEQPRVEDLLDCIEIRAAESA